MYYFGHDRYGIAGNVRKKYYYRPELFPLLKNNIKDIITGAWGGLWIFITNDDKIFYKGALPALSLYDGYNAPELWEEDDSIFVDLTESNWTFDSAIKKICFSGWELLYTMYVLTDSGTLYGFGRRDKGQLGNGMMTLGLENSIQSDFTIIESDVKDFAVGNDFFICVLNDENETIRGAGNNEYKQLGTYHNGNLNNSKYVDYIATLDSFNFVKNVKQISCGWSYVIFLTEDGTLWGAGANNLGQLGLPESSYDEVGVHIQEITYFKNLKINIKSIYAHNTISFL